VRLTQLGLRLFQVSCERHWRTQFRSDEQSASNAAVGNKTANLHDQIAFLLKGSNAIVKMEIQKRHDLIRSLGLTLAGGHYLVHFIAPVWSRTLRLPMATRMADHRFQPAVRRRQLPVSAAWAHGNGRAAPSEM
jgi:hypothetical protein